MPPFLLTRINNPTSATDFPSPRYPASREARILWSRYLRTRAFKLSNPRSLTLFIKLILGSRGIQIGRLIISLEVACAWPDEVLATKEEADEFWRRLPSLLGLSIKAKRVSEVDPAEAEEEEKATGGKRRLRNVDCRDKWWWCEGRKCE